MKNKTSAMILVAVALVASALSISQFWNGTKVVEEVTSLQAKINLNQLVGLSDAVVVATVASVKTEIRDFAPLPGEKAVYTVATVKVGEYLYNPGHITDSEMTISMVGGRHGNQNTDIEMALPVAGGQYVLFVKKDSKTNEFTIPAGPQGLFELADEQVGKGREQSRIAENVFGHSISLSALRGELKNAKPEPLPGLRQ